MSILLKLPLSPRVRKAGKPKASRVPTTQLRKTDIHLLLSSSPCNSTMTTASQRAPSTSAAPHDHPLPDNSEENMIDLEALTYYPAEESRFDTVSGYDELTLARMSRLAQAESATALKSRSQDVRHVKASTRKRQVTAVSSLPGSAKRRKHKYPHPNK